ncbi:MAG: Monovalent cation/H+ antiporter subunit F [Candidatus Tokpelaia hoelldobleri]|uniref:Monovalent cation/H+ antiporter subunit F n=1 Tax=Candidatus Tokpelaia hoelldobleri TaxID=1902579 RepID=A0A1U9JSF0_9HYPH|nr:MAG: Monovalent cation/H+ antiporter subunit F [Candidatus Tokpelaia hoelldoblerii]
MSVMILAFGIYLSQVILGIAMLLATIRLVLGPRTQDRIIALDTLYINTMILFMVFGIRTNTSLYFEMSLVIGLLGFVSTIALAKFLMRGEVIE